MAVEVHDNPDEQRYEAVVDGELAGFAAHRTQPGLITFVHTEVEDAFEGHGVGSMLIREALEDGVRGLPAVFDTKRRPWIVPDAAEADEVVAQVERCPSGALQAKRHREP